MNTEVNQEASAPEKECDKSRSEIINLISGLIVESKIALLASCGSDHVVRTCPMLNINKQFDGDLYFIAQSDDSVVERYRENPIANISLFESGQERFASICGNATTLDDPKKLELLWTDDCKKFFGLDRPNSDFVLIKVDVTEAEYWDQNESLASRFKRLVRRITGASPSVSDTCHEKVDWVEESIRSDRTSVNSEAQANVPAAVPGG